MQNPKSLKRKRNADAGKPGGRKRKATNVIRTLISHVEPKYFDITSLANSVGAGGTIFPLSPVPQGAAQSDRVGDFIQPRKWMFNYTLYTVNSDIVTTVRMIFFRWVPTTALIFPVLANILESPVSGNVLSHYNFQTQDNYEVLWERQFQCSGITVAPTVNSNFGATGMVVPLRSNSEIEFTLGATTGANQLFLLVLSDSALTPFPILNFVSRLYFEDTIKAGAPSGMPK